MVVDNGGKTIGISVGVATALIGDMSSKLKLFDTSTYTNYTISIQKNRNPQKDSGVQKN